MKINRPRTYRPLTHEGGTAKIISSKELLRRSVLSCLLWERTFYEDGVEISDRIADLVQDVGSRDPEFVRNLIVEARRVHNLRHCPLWMIVGLAGVKWGLTKELVRDTISRADEPAELLAMWWKDGKRPIPNAMKKGIALAFRKFDSYQLAKYDRAGAVRMRDALFLTHPKPKNEEMGAWWKQLIDGELPPPDTWEVGLSAGVNKKEIWTRLLSEGKLGYLALLRNLRNMHQAGISEDLVRAELFAGKGRHKVFPFRFIAAAKHNPQWEDMIEAAMISALKEHEGLAGKTGILVDVSGSMSSPLSLRSDMDCIDAACGLAVILRELCQEARVWTFSAELVEVPNRRGFALRDAIDNSQPHASTYLAGAVNRLSRHTMDRLVVVTDEQSHDGIAAAPIKDKSYLINVASYRNGVGYRDWTHIDGFSEAVIKWIIEHERAQKTNTQEEK